MLNLQSTVRHPKLCNKKHTISIGKDGVFSIAVGVENENKKDEEPDQADIERDLRKAFGQLRSMYFERIYCAALSGRLQSFLQVLWCRNGRTTTIIGSGQNSRACCLLFTDN